MRKKEFDLEYQYQLYLKRVDLDANKMPMQQRIETRQAFFGACGQMLLLLRDDVGELEEQEAINVMQEMIEQVGKYFSRRIK